MLHVLVFAVSIGLQDVVELLAIFSQLVRSEQAETICAVHIPESQRAKSSGSK